MKEEAQGLVNPFKSGGSLFHTWESCYGPFNRCHKRLPALSAAQNRQWLCSQVQAVVQSAMWPYNMAAPIRDGRKK